MLLNELDDKKEADTEGEEDRAVSYSQQEEQEQELSDTEIQNPAPELLNVEGKLIKEEIKEKDEKVEKLPKEDAELKTPSDFYDIPYQNTNNNEDEKSIVEEQELPNENEAAPEDLPIEDPAYVDETPMQEEGNDNEQGAELSNETNDNEEAEPVGEEQELSDENDDAPEDLSDPVHVEETPNQEGNDNEQGTEEDKPSTPIDLAPQYMFDHNEQETPKVDEVPRQENNADEQEESEVENKEEEDKETPEQLDEDFDETDAAGQSYPKVEAEYPKEKADYDGIAAKTKADPTIPPQPNGHGIFPLIDPPRLSDYGYEEKNKEEGEELK